MKTEGGIFVGTAMFFLVVTAVYWFTSYEDTGTVLLLLTAGLGAIPGAWLLWISRHHPPRLEDAPEATIAEGAGRVGSFPESSVWPLVFAGGIALASIGLVFGFWLALPGVVLLAVAVVGTILESRRGAEAEDPSGEPEGP